MKRTMALHSHTMTYLVFAFLILLMAGCANWQNPEPMDWGTLSKELGKKTEPQP